MQEKIYEFQQKLNLDLSEQEYNTVMTKSCNLLEKFSYLGGYDIDISTRVAFIGSNGSGKSTLVKTIMNTQDLKVSGNIKIGPSVKIGYLQQ